MSKVLVVDDSDVWCDAVATELGKAGYSVIQAKHQAEALAVAADEKPSLILVDLLIAAQAGVGFVRRLRSLPSMKDIPMMLTTAGTDPRAVQRAMGDGINHVISKNRRALGDLSELLRKPLAAC